LIPLLELPVEAPAGFFEFMGAYWFPISISIEVKGIVYAGTIVPFKFELPCGLPYLYRIVFDDRYYGDVRNKNGVWECEGMDQALIDAISNYIELWYE
jgi:hypothetical protein